MFLFRVLFLQSGLRGSQTRDRHTEGRAGHVIKTDVMAELHRARITAVLATDAKLDVRTGFAAQLSRQLNQLAHALLIESRKGIRLVDLRVIVGVQELARIVTAEAESHLGQIGGAEGEELGFLGDFIGRNRSARTLEHGPHRVG